MSAGFSPHLGLNISFRFDQQHWPENHGRGQNGHLSPAGNWD